MTNKYEALSIPMHIKMVQRGHLKLQEDKNSNLKISTFSKRASELSEMKYFLQERLIKMDRNTVEYFPVDSLVEYVHPMYSQKQKIGYVKDHVHRENLGSKCLCKFEGDDFFVEVDPSNLKLRFIRSGYPF